jgi:hypothetical protein
MNYRKALFLLSPALALFCAGCASGLQHQHEGTSSPESTLNHGATLADTRFPVHFPDPMRIHTLANMRDHLRTLAAIQVALANGAFDEASRLAEQNLGLTSLAAHGAHELSGYMPEGMQALGTGMHKNASQFATEIQNAGATGDLKPALAALGRTTQACVACHAGYRLQ